MNAHDPNGVSRRRLAGAEGLLAVFDEAAQERDEAEQAFIAAPLASDGQFQETHQIAPPERAASEGAHDAQETCRFVDVPKESVGRHVRGRVPERVKLLQESVRFRALFRRLLKRAVKISVFVRKADLCQLVRRKAVNGASQNSDERYILPRVVE